MTGFLVFYAGHGTADSPGHAAGGPPLLQVAPQPGERPVRLPHPPLHEKIKTPGPLPTAAAAGSGCAWAGYCSPATALASLVSLGRPDSFTGWYGGALVGAQCGVMALSLVPVERALKRTFDENGNRREGGHPSDTPAP